MKQNLTLGTVPLRNLRAHPARTVILLLLTLAQAACVYGGLGMLRSAREDMQRAEARLGADILLYPSSAMSKIAGDALLMQGTPVDVRKSRSTLSRLQDCEGIAAVAYHLYLKDTTGESPLWITGYDPAADFVLSPWTRNDAAASLKDGAVLAGCRVSPGQESVTLFGEDWPIAARLEETGSELDGMVFVNLQTLSLLTEAAARSGITAFHSLEPRTDYSVALIRVQDRRDLESITNWLNVYIRKVKAIRSEETLTDTASGIRGQITLTAAVAAGAWLVLLLSLGIAQTLMMKERKKELYLWHALGASRSIVRGVMLREALVIHAAGALLGVLFCALLFALTGRGGPSPVFALLTVLLTLLTGWAGTALAVRRAVRSMKGQMLLTV